MELPPNRFAKHLVPLLKRYFDPDATRSSRDLVERAYVSTRNVTHYEGVLEALLQDNLAGSKYPLFDEVETTSQSAFQFSATLRSAITAKTPTKDALLLITGSVGVGKSMFIDRFFYHLLDEDLSKTTVWFLVDFNHAPDDLAHLDRWIVDAALADMPIRNSLSDFLSLANLERYFAPDLNRRKAGPYAELYKSQRDEYDRRIADDLASWHWAIVGAWGSHLRGMGVTPSIF